MEMLFSQGEVWELDRREIADAVRQEGSKARHLLLPAPRFGSNNIVSTNKAYNI